MAVNRPTEDARNRKARNAPPENNLPAPSKQWARWVEGTLKGVASSSESAARNSRIVSRAATQTADLAAENVVANRESQQQIQALREHGAHTEEALGDAQLKLDQAELDLLELNEVTLPGLEQELTQLEVVMDALADGSHVVYDEIRAIEETLDGTVRVWRTPDRPTDLNDTTDLADLWVNPSDPSDIWRWEGTVAGWVKQDDPDLSEFYTRLDAAESALGTLHDTTLPALDGRLDSIDGEVADAQQGISGLISRVDTVETDVSAAQSAAEDAQQAADDAAADAVAKANAAEQAAKAHAEAVAEAERLAAIAAASDDATAKANAAEAAATAAAAADAKTKAGAAQAAAEAKAATAQSRADAAHALATQAKAAADAADAKAVLAQQSADGKSTVTYGASKKSSGAAGKAGDTHFRFSGSNLIGVQRHTGSAWVDAEWSHQVIGSIDLGKATVGQLDGQFIKANTVTADKLLVGSFDNLIADVVSDSHRGTEPHEASGFGTLSTEADSSDADGVSPGRHLYVGRTEGDAGLARPVMAWSGADGTNRIRVEPGGRYRFSVLTRLGGAYPNGIGYMRLAVRELTDSGSYVTFLAHGGTHSPNWSWQEHVAEFTVGPGTRFVVLEIQMTAVGANYRLALPQFRQMNAGELIVDGSILARHIDVNSLLAKLIEVDALLAMSAEIGEAWIEQGWIKSLVVDVADVEGLTFTNASGRFLRTELFAANSITAEKLLIGTAANVIPGADDIASNPQGFPAAKGWGVNSTHPSAWVQGKRNVESLPFTLRAGDRVRISADVQASSSGTRFYMGIAPAGSFSTASGAIWGGASNALAPTAFSEFSGEVVVPETRSDWTFSVIAQYATGSENPTGYTWFRNPRVANMVGATIIEDGAITTEKVAANAITANKIAAGAVTANKIAANSITSNKITTDDLVGLSITGSTITGTTITGVDITGSNTLTGGDLTVRGGQILFENPLDNTVRSYISVDSELSQSRTHIRVGLRNGSNWVYTDPLIAYYDGAAARGVLVDRDLTVVGTTSSGRYTDEVGRDVLARVNGAISRSANYSKAAGTADVVFNQDSGTLYGCSRSGTGIQVSEPGVYSITMTVNVIDSSSTVGIRPTINGVAWGEWNVLTQHGTSGTQRITTTRTIPVPENGIIRVSLTNVSALTVSNSSLLQVTRVSI